MQAIVANDLKTRGVSALEEGLQSGPEVMITVRGKDQYVVMRVEQYHYLREMELEAALLEARQDVANGNVIRESAEAHVNRVAGE
ncbi:MAG: prevent-host-death protein [Zetaproteobacteria bacterium CG12_big_fil_rev_8_21_14_0_65_55_1124]|nr:MAG: prevent-host-death protein [Zetaproteobacteria bacterium CG1_02_55_237]PIS19505.1 MAG: prevent-host-death protein [Zetaproteobacteria bacterium CG08_land_8_20_14_0_20_55_17]PIW42393.1 MAG: prevent-host-death protein [Zetaproteobacteria bacterium CG12_big_fil_rev_8_21_14_0_65_55_1124]PIY52805.1 MAG: prevent-host-death protein [Zetaproteobacteria bacterium CG_4_10_14_0_8_um_filter_55_43]PIZ38011.1 MAG: prevent-host-death protein [Zetaproteobacteria bacterium CG_4_10_14_0_2_um_filter_55_20